MKVKEIINIIEDFAPKSLAYNWDNTGFLCGDENEEVKKIYITLDVNRETVDEAVKKGADMIISHHPILMNAIKIINYNTTEGYIIKSLIENKISLYAAHTSMDNAKGGINDILAEKLGLENTAIIEKSEIEGCGLGRVGKINKTTLREFADKVKDKLNTPFVRVCGDINKEINTVAVGSGSCGDLIDDAIKMGADIMVTADMKYHNSIDSVENGICVIDAGHYPTEIFVMDIFENILKDCDVEIIKSNEKDIFNII